jgi:sn-glycerol 3-phosphate transport system permease protein
MTIHANMIPFFILTALAGAAYMAYAFSRFHSIEDDTIFKLDTKSEPPTEPSTQLLGTGAVIGLIAGLVGPLIFMLPLSSCTFEAEREAIDVIFGIILFILGAFLLLKFTKWFSQLFVGGQGYKALISDQNTEGTFKSGLLTPFLLLLPTIVILLYFLYYPLIETFRLSTLLIQLGSPRSRFQCVTNFTDFFESSRFDVAAMAFLAAAIIIIIAYQFSKIRETIGNSMVANTLVTILLVAFLARTLEEGYGKVLFNTFFIAIAIVITGLALGLAIAYLAFQDVKGAMIYRTLLIWPYAISPAIAGIIFFVIFDPVSGILNHVIELLGGQGPEWIKDPWWARVTIIVASVWKTLGYNILFYIAGLQTVPPDLVEAAAIDGANSWQRFRNVVIPALSPITFFLIVTNLTYAFFNIFGTIDFLTRGGPYGSTSVSIYEIFQLGIRSKDLGRAAAQSLVLFIIVIGVTIFQFRTSGRRVTYGA